MNIFFLFHRFSYKIAVYFDKEAFLKKETQVCFIIDFLFILSWGAILYLMFLASKLLWPFFPAFLSALIFIKLSQKVEKHIPLKSKWAAVICAVFFYLLVSLVMYLALTEILKDMMSLSKKLPQLISPFLEKLKEYENLENGGIYSFFLSSADEAAKNLSGKFMDLTAEALKKLPLFLAGFLFTILSSFYIAVDFYRIKSFFKRAVPQKFHFFFLGIKDFSAQCLLKIAKAYGILMILTFSELAVGFFILKIDNFLKFALVTSLLDILPLLGTGCVLLPWAAVSFISKNSPLGWGLIILWLFVTIVRNIEEPRLIGKELGLPPLLSLIACFTGLRLMGLKGMIIFPVLFLAVKYIFGNMPYNENTAP